MNGPLKLTQTPEFPWTMTEEQLRGYLDDLGARWPDSEEAFSRGALRDPASAYADLYYQVALQTPLELAMRIVDEQVRIDHIPVLPTLQIPVLAAYGRYDPYYPIALAEFIAAHGTQRKPCRLRGERPRAALRGARPLLRGHPRLHARPMTIFHAASIEVAVPAETAFAYLSDGLKQGDWTLGSWNRENAGDGLFRGTSLFNGADTFVRITAACRAAARRLRGGAGARPAAPRQLGARSFPGPPSAAPRGRA